MPTDGTPPNLPAVLSSAPPFPTGAAHDGPPTGPTGIPVGYNDPTDAKILQGIGDILKGQDEERRARADSLWMLVRDILLGPVWPGRFELRVGVIAVVGTLALVAAGAFTMLFGPEIVAAWISTLIGHPAPPLPVTP